MGTSQDTSANKVSLTQNRLISYYIGELKANMAQYLAAQIVAGLRYLRTQKIVHRDLKPANILLDEEFKCILSDFGTAKKIESSNMSSNSVGNTSELSYISGLSNISYISDISGNKSTDTVVKSVINDQKQVEMDDIVGTEWYISPEMLENRTYSYASDLWSLGVIIYQLFTTKVPFKGSCQEDTFDKIKNSVLKMPQNVPSDAADLI